MPKKILDDEARFKVQRQRWGFVFGIGILTLIVVMYLVVGPLITFYSGRHLDLPNGEVVFVLLIMAGSAVFAFDIKDVIALAKGVRITYVAPAPEPKETSDEPTIRTRSGDVG